MLYEFSFIPMSFFFTFDFGILWGPKTCLMHEVLSNFRPLFKFNLIVLNIPFQHIFMLYEFSFISMSSFLICLDKGDIFGYFPNFRVISPFFPYFPLFCKGENDFLTKR